MSVEAPGGVAVRTGLDVVARDATALTGRRTGLLTNDTGVTARFERNIDVLRRGGVDLAVVFSPEHGLTGTAQAGESEPSGVDPATGLPVVDTYGSGPRMDRLIDGHDLDVLVIDLQDVGVRYWTYTWSMYDALAACARLGIEVVVLDRPNPLGGIWTEGTELDRGFASFVGRTGVRQRHGLTSGELARLFNRRDIPREADREAGLTVIAMSGWERGMSWPHHTVPWVMPSPNMPTTDSVLAFAATGLLEGTNASEGRGTTRPFEIFGAPYVDDRLVRRLRSLELPGVAFREVQVRPVFHKHAGSVVRGAQLYVTDRDAYRPVRTGVAIVESLARLYPDSFEVLADGGGDADHRGHALDRLWGSDGLRRALDEGREQIWQGVPEAPVVEAYPDDLLLY